METSVVVKNCTSHSWMSVA